MEKIVKRGYIVWGEGGRLEALCSEQLDQCSDVVLVAKAVHIDLCQWHLWLLGHLNVYMYRWLKGNLNPWFIGMGNLMEKAPTLLDTMCLALGTCTAHGPRLTA